MMTSRTPDESPAVKSVERWTFEFKPGQSYPVDLVALKSCKGEFIAFLVLSHAPDSMSRAYTTLLVLDAASYYTTFEGLVDDLATLAPKTPVFGLSFAGMERSYSNEYDLIAPIENHQIEDINNQLSARGFDVRVTREDGNTRFDPFGFETRDNEDN
ncbi:MAG: hypothetical protein IT449_07360 [Phycisphaerales bacterium]|nr:hypothetical protein [Phycisphaerales bacterium]